jgi:hypothetical protein
VIELISVHIPKTAGTAFSALLNAVYSTARLRLDYDDHIFAPNARFQTEFSRWDQDNETFLDSLSSEVVAVHGHFWLGKYARRFPTARRIVWLRNPVDQLISLYFYWRAVPDLANPICKQLLENDLTPTQFAALPELHNMVTSKSLRGYEVKDFNFIGIQEFFAEDVTRLCQIMSWGALAVSTANKTSTEEYQRFEPEPALIKIISRFNAVDIQFYKQALARRNSED